MIYPTSQSYREAWAKAYTHDPEVPLNVDIELASTCNARCTFCLYGDNDWFKSMQEKDWDGGNKKRLMPRELAFKIIDQCADIGVPALKFNFRGESLIHPDYGDIVEYAASQKKFIGSFGYLGYQWECVFKDLLANTNGNIPDRVRESGLRGLMACTKVMISLDSMDPDIYPKVRVGLSLEDAKQTIDDLVALGHPNLWIRRVACKSNKDEDFVGAVKARWPKGVQVSEHAAFDRNHLSKEEVVEEDHSTWERTYCGYPSQRIVIEASGRYSACCIAWEGELSGGAFPQMSLMDYWNSAWRKKLAFELRNNRFTSPKCSACTSYMSYKRPERDFVQDVAK